jgi:glycosyltransferase involved in cell wall biosynthesis
LVFSPYAVDTSAFQTEEKDRLRLRGSTRKGLGVKEGQILLLFSGKFIPRKAPDLLLYAVKRLPREVRARMGVVFLGDGELREELKALAKAPPPVDAHFVGFQNQTQISPYFHASDILVLPSRSEPWGLVVNEALHHGLPVVVSDAVGCAPDLVESGVNGYVFETDSLSGLASCLVQALKFENQPVAREKCRRKVGGYSIESAARGIKAAYCSIL